MVVETFPFLAPSVGNPAEGISSPAKTGILSPALGLLTILQGFAI